MIRRGFLHWARIDKRRPVVVVSPDHRNRLANDVTIVPCSTARRIFPTHVLLRAGEAGLSSSSAAKCEQVTTLLQSDLDSSPLGSALSRERMDEIERALLSALGVEPTALARHLRHFLEWHD